MSPGETNLSQILKTLSPELNSGEYIFYSTKDPSQFDLKDIIGLFKEKEGVTVIISKELADIKKISYKFIASWITLNVHSSLASVGLTAAFSNALTRENISANVIAGYYHDHIFVAKEDTDKAMKTLTKLSETN
ncbi:MAG: ACT domain-containing protein [Bacteroidota bacterium]